MMIVGTVPIVVCGLLFKDTIETTLRSLYVVAGAMIGLAVVLAGAELLVRARQRRGQAAKQLADVTWTDAIVTGLAQALALVPGSSRSGVTITAGLFAGMSRETAARFSFLLSLPSVLAAGLYQLYKARESLLGSQADAMALGVATLASAIVGYLSIAFLLRYLKTHTTGIFIGYRLAVGGLLLWWLSQGVLSPM
jgi:undecaprenyl-diphosphatase